MNGPDSEDGAEESADFQLPVLGLYADLELGRGSVHLPDEFQRCSSAMRIEIINDWVKALGQSRQRALIELYRQLSAGLDDLGAAERLQRFRATCLSLGIDVPDDFAVPAQPY